MGVCASQQLVLCTLSYFFLFFSLSDSLTTIYVAHHHFNLSALFFLGGGDGRDNNVPIAITNKP